MKHIYKRFVMHYFYAAANGCMFES